MENRPSKTSELKQTYISRPLMRNASIVLGCIVIGNATPGKAVTVLCDEHT